MKRLITLFFFLLPCLNLAWAQVETEPNNTIIQNSAANTFAAPISVAANITLSPDDRDFLRIDLPYCSTWKFNIINPNGSPCTLKMHLYNGPNTSSHIFGSNGVTFNFSNGIPKPVLLNCGGTIYLQIDQTSGANLGAYAVSVTEDIGPGYFKCNNSFGNAPLIPGDTLIKERLRGYNCNGTPDKAFYKIAPNPCGVLEVRATGVNASQRLVLSVYDAQFNLLNLKTASSNGSSLTSTTLLSGNEAYLSVHEWTGGCCSAGYNTYQLSDDPFDLNFRYDTTETTECNNSFVTAFPLPLDTTFDAKLWGTNYLISDGQPYDRNGDQDYFVVNAPYCGVWEVGITGANANQRMKIDVYDSLFTLVNSAVAPANGSNVSAATLLEGGVYYLRINEWTGGCCSAGYNTYQLADDPYTLTLSFDDSDAAECNNSFVTAYPIPLDTTFDAKLWGKNFLISDGQPYDRNGDQDYFVVNAPYCGVWEVGITGANANQRMKIDVYDSLFILVNSAVASANGSNVSAATLLEGGVYYLRINEWTGGCCSAGYNTYQLADDPYTLTVSFDDSDAAECNNSFVTAYPIPLDTTFDAKLWGKNFLISDGQPYDRNGDQDYFVVNAPYCGVWEVRITGANANQRMRIDVYDSLFTLVNSKIASANGSNVFTATLLEGGVYYLRINEWTGGCCSAGYNTYHLADDPYTLTTHFDDSDAAECNNSFVTAFPLPLDTTFDAKLWGFNYLISDGQFIDLDQDQDYYKINITECGNWSMAITGVNSAQRLEIQIYDTLSNLVDNSLANANGDNLSSNTLLAPGDYYVRLREWTGGCCSSGYNVYSLRDDPFTINTSFAPLAQITASSDTICPGDSVYFSSPNTGTSWLWDFGPQASPNSSSLQTPPVVVFSNPGTNQVVLSVNGCSYDTLDIEVKPLSPAPSISASGPSLSSSSSTGNQWYLNGNLIPGATSNTYTATQSGLYYVCVSNPQDCGTPCSDTLQVTLVGVQRGLSPKDVKVYPNPTAGRFTLEFPSGTKKIVISNALGQELFDCDVPKTENTKVMDLPEMGVYFITVVTLRGTTTKKLIVAPY